MTNPQPELLRAAALHRARKFDEAVGCCERILAQEPENPSALHLAGLAHFAAGRSDRAVALFRQCLELRPDFAEAHSNLARALLARDNAPEALAFGRRACELAPQRAEMHANLGNVYQALGRHEEAVGAYECALAHRPQMAAVRNGRGNSLKILGRLEEAVADFERAVELVPESAAFWNNLANTLCDLKRFDRADAAYARGLALQPDSSDIRHNQSLSYLIRGDFGSGWKDFECRWERVKGTPLRSFSAPRWTGREPLQGRSLLLHAEQGLGDTLQFVRYARILAQEAGADIVLEVPPPLQSLLAVQPYAKRVIAVGDPIPPVDFQCPLMSVPGLLATRLDSIPSVVPYLTAAPERVDGWRRTLPSVALPRVGVVWAGNLRHPNDHARSIPLPRLCQGLEGLRGTFFSLQKIPRPEELALLRSTPALLDLSAHLTDFAETAAIVASLDLIITVDTAVAHLAGALAIPTWVLLPYAADWRWMLDRADSPWYPTMQLFRQPQPGDWTSVFGALRAQWPAA